MTREVPRAKQLVPYDYFSPYFAVSLVIGGVELPLWTQEEGSEALSAAQGLGYEGRNLMVVQEVLIEWQGLAYQTTINLTPNYDDAIKLVDSYLLQQGKTLSKVEIGFRRGPEGPVTQTFNGVVTEVDFSIGTEISLTLKTVPPQMASAPQRGSDKKNKEDPWNDTSPFDVIKQLWENQKDSKVEVIAPDGDEAIKQLKTKVDSIARGSLTNWGLIQKLADANYCVLRVDGSKLEIDSHLNSVGASQPVAAFHLFSGGKLGGGTNAYPITSASLKTSDLFARTLSGYNITGTDEDTGEAVTQTVGTPGADVPGATKGGQTKSTASKPGGGPSPDTSVVPEGGARSSTVQNPKDKKAQNTPLRRAIDEWKKQGIQLEIESLLIPHLAPHVNIDVSGMGSRIDGRYWIEKLFFQVGVDGGLTRFDCVKTATNDGPGQVDPLPGKVNTAPEAESSGSTEAKAESEG